MVVPQCRTDFRAGETRFLGGLKEVEATHFHLKMRETFRLLPKMRGLGLPTTGGT